LANRSLRALDVITADLGRADGRHALAVTCARPGCRRSAQWLVAAARDDERLHDDHPGSGLRKLGLALLACCICARASAHVAPASAHVTDILTICADPNNLPFSNQARQGFENKIAELIARQLRRPLAYLWWAQRRGYVRNTLNEAKCDIWPGVASGVDRLASTHPYYRSTYVFVVRADAHLAGLTLDDPRLRSLSIGVQMVGSDGNNTPPAHAIASRGILNNVHGYMLYGNYAQPNPAAIIMTAVEDGDVEVALVWGPLAGFFAHRSPLPLMVYPVTPAAASSWPMTFDISMGVRAGNSALLEQVNAALTHEQPAIDAILRAYGVPRAETALIQ
jgi:mxaJ protein